MIVIVIAKKVIAGFFMLRLMVPEIPVSICLFSDVRREGCGIWAKQTTAETESQHWMNGGLESQLLGRHHLTCKYLVIHYPCIFEY